MPYCTREPVATSVVHRTVTFPLGSADHAGPAVKVAADNPAGIHTANNPSNRSFFIDEKSWSAISRAARPPIPGQ
ncbi:hypothetical protein LBMAG56_25120 [Verrucomicrobiota bacterium]|nr:hypothetical protein LBMAG56_25120 [Verrucomicrobiota bacterium]